jgi:hypothetical protein
MYDIMLDLAIALALLSLIYPGLVIAAVALGIMIAIDMTIDIK